MKKDFLPMFACAILPKSATVAPKPTCWPVSTNFALEGWKMSVSELEGINGPHNRNFRTTWARPGKACSEHIQSAYWCIATAAVRRSSRKLVDCCVSYGAPVNRSSAQRQGSKVHKADLEFNLAASSLTTLVDAG